MTRKTFYDKFFIEIDFHFLLRMQSDTVQKPASSVKHEKRLDLAIDGETTMIKLSSWVEGLGWCGEKTLSIEPEMVDELHRMLAAARVKLRTKRSEGDAVSVPGENVLRFPN